MIERAKLEVSKKNRQTLLEPTKKSQSEEQERIFLTTTYREGYQYVPKIVKRDWDILARSSTTKNIQ